MLTAMAAERWCHLGATENMVEAALKLMDAKMVKHYATILTQKADEQFWAELAKIEDSLIESFKRRPLEKMRIQTMATNFERDFRKLCLEARQRERSRTIDPKGSQGSS